jgi:hypothetical protein
MDASWMFADDFQGGGLKRVINAGRLAHRQVSSRCRLTMQRRSSTRRGVRAISSIKSSMPGKMRPKSKTGRRRFQDGLGPETEIGSKIAIMKKPRVFYKSAAFYSTSI